MEVRFRSWDNRQVWQQYDYRDDGITTEPYLDFDFNEVLYLTDTGRRWNGDKVAVRDKVKTPLSYNLRTTFDVMRALHKKELPAQVMVTTHPQRWSNDPIFWAEELFLQNVKNVVKKFLFVK